MLLDSANTSRSICLHSDSSFGKGLFPNCLISLEAARTQTKEGVAYRCFTICKYFSGNGQIIQSVLLCGAVQKFMLVSVASRLKVENARLWLLVHSFLQTSLRGALWLNKLARFFIALRVKWELPESLQNCASATLTLIPTFLPATCRTANAPQPPGLFWAAFCFVLFFSFQALLYPSSFFPAQPTHTCPSCLTSTSPLPDLLLQRLEYVSPSPHSKSARPSHDSSCCLLKAMSSWEEGAELLSCVSNTEPKLCAWDLLRNDCQRI